MKKLKQLSMLLLIFCFASIQSWAINLERDSVIINYGSTGKIVIYAESADELEQLKAIDFNELIAEVQFYVDSAQNIEDGVLEVNNSKFGEYNIYTEDVPLVNEKPQFSLSSDDGIFSTSIQKRKVERVKRTSRRGNGWRYRGPTKFGVGLDLGLNGYLKDGEIPNGTDYDLRPGASRYVAINLKWKTRLKRRLYFTYGFSFSWNNYMFEGNQLIIEEDSQPLFVSAGLNLEKSKLTTAFLDVPFMLQFGKNRSSLFRFGIGGYVGYRLDSYSKIEFDDGNDSDVDREHSDFGLEPLRYGISTELGLRGLGPKLFFNYGLNQLFTDNSGAPDLNNFSFGLRF